MSTVEDVIGGPLDLTGADTSTFDPIPTGRYNATVWDAFWDRTKGGEGAKLPAGTPMLKIQFRLSDEYADKEYVNQDGETTKIGKNRRVFAQYVVAPADYDAEKAAKTKGMMVNMLKGLGYDEKKITSGKFQIDCDDMKTRECVVVLGQPSKGYTSNPVNGVKPAGSPTDGGAASPGSGLL